MARVVKVGFYRSTGDIISEVDVKNVWDSDNLDDELKIVSNAAFTTDIVDIHNLGLVDPDQLKSLIELDPDGKDESIYDFGDLDKTLLFNVSKVDSEAGIDYITKQSKSLYKTRINGKDIIPIVLKPGVTHIKLFSEDEYEKSSANTEIDKSGMLSFGGDNSDYRMVVLVDDVLGNISDLRTRIHEESKRPHRDLHNIILTEMDSTITKNQHCMISKLDMDSTTKSDGDGDTRLPITITNIECKDVRNNTRWCKKTLNVGFSYLDITRIENDHKYYIDYNKL